MRFDHGRRVRDWRPIRWLRSRLGLRRHAEMEASEAEMGNWLRFDPEVSIRQTHDGFEVSMDLPGVGRDDVDARGSGARLTIQGRRTRERDSASEVVLMCARGYGSFCRSFVIPDGADAEQAQAFLADGVLTVFVPREKAARVRRIAVKS